MVHHPGVQQSDRKATCVVVGEIFICEAVHNVGIEGVIDWLTGLYPCTVGLHLVRGHTLVAEEGVDAVDSAHGTDLAFMVGTIQPCRCRWGWVGEHTHHRLGWVRRAGEREGLRHGRGCCGLWISGNDNAATYRANNSGRGVHA